MAKLCPSNPSLTTVLYVLFKQVRALNRVKECERISTDPGALLDPGAASELQRIVSRHPTLPRAHFHSEGGGWIPRSSVSWRPDLVSCHLFTCLNFCFLIYEMGMVMPALSTSQGDWAAQGWNRPFIRKCKRRKTGASVVTAVCQALRSPQSRPLGSHSWPVL